MEDHKFLAYKAAAPTRIATELAEQLANYYAKAEYSRTQWKRQPTRTCRWERISKSPTGDGSLVATEHESKPFNMEMIRKHLLDARAFRQEDFALPSPESEWLDHMIDMSIPFHITDNAGDTVKMRVLTQLGPAFPLAPILDREGAAYTSFQTILVQTMIDTRNWLVEHSQEFHTLTWLEKLRILVGESVSLVENTLHQFFYKAKYAPLPGWSFDEQALPPRVGQRIMDKLKWVRAITGRSFEDRDGTAALRRVKTIRNHLQHFDPPVFAYTLEDVVGWLNDVSRIAQLVWRIRRALDALPSNTLITMLLCPEVEFRPARPEARRSRQAADCGYASSCEERLESGRHWKEAATVGTVTIQRPGRERVL